MRPLVVLPLAGALALLPAVALATPTVTVAPTIQRFNADGSVAPTRNITVGGTLAQAINFDDCNNNTYITFAVSTAGFDGTSSLQAWAGPSDCTPSVSRIPPSQVCWPVVGGNLPSSVTQTPHVNVRDIVSQLGLAGSQININYVPAGQSVCNAVPVTYSEASVFDEAGSSAGSGISSVSVYFIWVPSGGGDGVSAGAPFKVKLAGPAAPTGVGVSAGDTLLKVSWTVPIDPTLAGFDVFTDPPVNGTVSPIPFDATPYQVTTCRDGGFTDGGFDDAGSPIQGQPIDGGCSTTSVNPQDPNVGDGGSGTCGSSVLGSGKPASALYSYLVPQTAGQTSASLEVSGLTNGNTYNVAVASTDNFGNAGPLSAISTTTCGTPAPINDFWKIYNLDGGTAGGSCAQGDLGAAGRAPLFGLSVLGLLGLYLKRRQK